jgi:hypothetical protein
MRSFRKGEGYANNLHNRRAGRLLFAEAKGSVTYSEVVAHLGKERDDSGLPFTEIIDATEARSALSAAEVRKSWIYCVT